MPASVEEGLGDGTVAKVLKRPEQPTAAEIEQHEAQRHIRMKLRGTYRRWCPQCVSGRGVGRQHRRVAHFEEELPVVHLDYAFFGSGASDDSERIAMTALYDSKTRTTGAIGLPRKWGTHTQRAQ
eukprot:1068637-Amphidinium_carterae.1